MCWKAVWSSTKTTTFPIRTKIFKWGVRVRVKVNPIESRNSWLRHSRWSVTSSKMAAGCYWSAGEGGSRRFKRDGQCSVDPSKSPFRRCSRCRIETERAMSSPRPRSQFKKLMFRAKSSSVLLCSIYFCERCSHPAQASFVAADMQTLESFDQAWKCKREFWQKSGFNVNAFLDEVVVFSAN